MLYTFLINAQFDWQETNHHAIELIKSVKQNDHQIAAVFLYGHSVRLFEKGNQYTSKWQTLYDVIDGPILVCSTMIEHLKINTSQITSPFQLSGMAPWVLAVEKADKMVELN